MSIDSALGGIQSITNTISSAVNIVTRAGADVGLGGVGGAGAYWKDRLFPASYRGIKFGVLEGSGHFGRRNVVHEYPYRDTVWVEDLGRSARRISMTGFLVGDDVIAQRERLIAVCEKDGDGILVHPTLGTLTVNMLGSVAVNERWDRGRVFELSFTFIESGKRIFPQLETSTADAVGSAADLANISASSDFVTRASSALKQGAAAVKQAIATTSEWTIKAQKLSNDATNLYNMAGTLQGSYGRFFSGRNSGGLSNVKTVATVATMAGLIAKGSAARAAVSGAINTLSSAASGLGL